MDTGNEKLTDSIVEPTQIYNYEVAFIIHEMTKIVIVYFCQQWEKIEMHKDAKDPIVLSVLTCHNQRKALFFYTNNRLWF